MLNCSIFKTIELPGVLRWQRGTYWQLVHLPSELKRQALTEPSWPFFNVTGPSFLNLIKDQKD